MWRDDRDLSHELAAAGAAARHQTAADSLPSAAFAANLRRSLVTQIPPVADAPRRWSFADAFRGRRLAPILAGALLSVAVGAAAGAALIATRPQPTPPATTPAPIVVGVPGGEVLTTASPTPTPTATPTPTPTPSPTPSPTPTPTPSPTPTPTPKPTPKPTPVPTPVATPVPTPVPTPTFTVMSLGATGCGGGVVLEWSAVGDPAFKKYVTLRSASASIPAAYPAQGGAVELAWTRTGDRNATSAPDASAMPGTTFFYRTLALNSAGGVIGASAVQAASATAVQSLGSLGAAAVDATKTKFTWATYAGSQACFTYYKLVYSETNPTPSYPNGDPYWAAISDKGVSSYVVDGLVSGTTYYVRLQAVRATALGPFVVAETDVLSYTAP
ncbi:MAG TPA: fibronectin type III domain-containing protein [Candidatus Limnocylindria bacterium]|nr:fibronectin type III domain-containing protein [Candidatus Limnocylindria bacterium]